MENKVRFKLHKVKKHWITIAASSLAIGASLIGLGQVGADEVKPETTAVTSPENVVSDSNLETSASLITRTEVAPTSTTVEKASSEAVSSDTTSTNVATQPTETTATGVLPAKPLYVIPLTVAVFSCVAERVIVPEPKATELSSFA